MQKVMLASDPADSSSSGEDNKYIDDNDKKYKDNEIVLNIQNNFFTLYKIVQ